MSNEKVIVTGGAGFIGSHVAQALVNAGYQVLVVDDLSTGKTQNIPADATFHELDIRSPEAAALFEQYRPSMLFHLAAQMDVRKSVYDPVFDADVNIKGILNLLSAGVQNGLKRVVFSSTGGAIYGEQDVYPAGEDHQEWPLSPYGVAKLTTEKYLYYYHQEFGLDSVCLRYANVYGPRQNSHGEAGVVAIFVSRLLAGEQPTIYGDGLNTRDYTYVEDVVRANMAALSRPGFAVYNVGTGVETTVNELYDAIRRGVGSDIAAAYAEERPGEQRRSSISAQKIYDELKVEISTNLPDGLAQTINWYKSGRQESAYSASNKGEGTGTSSLV